MPGAHGPGRCHDPLLRRRRLKCQAHGFQGAGVERRYRLRGRTNFLRIRQQGQRWVHPLVILGAFPNDLDWTRCGFIVSRKLGHAVVRNRVRRRLREAVRIVYRHISPGRDLVWIARPPILQADFTQVSAAVAGLLQQARLWQPVGEDD